ncbi:MAG: restriction endonuclease [Chiayiivirga sp.]|jgi:restriction system protein|nr:restriction endonuclease [Chiayiivirga sp.]
MARRTRKSGFDDAVEVFSRLPWYVCVGLAVFAYALLHQLSQIAIPAASSPAHAASVMVATVAKTAGFIGQYLVPLIFLVSALVSWLSQRRRTRLLHEAESRTSSAPLRQMSWRDFERLVGAHFERLGYSVSLTPDGADGGVDVIARKGHETFLIQCKQWRATQVGVAVVRELFGLMAAKGATGAFVVSIGPFSADAKAFAEGRNISLVDAHSLLLADGAAGKNCG